MSDPITFHPLSGEGRKFNWMPVLDGYILRSFLIPFGILLFAFTLLFIIMDMYNEIGDFLEHDAPLSVSVRFFALKIPGNIRFILPITVLLACMYALANLGRNRELTAIRASGISLMRCGVPIFAVGFCVMLVNYYFNEKLVPETTRQAEIVRKKVSNPNYVEETNARLQFHSGDLLRQWYFGQFNDDGYQEKVKIKFFAPHSEDGLGFSDRWKKARSTADAYRWPRIMIQAETTRFIPETSDEPGFWEFNIPVVHEYPDDAGNTPQGILELKSLSLNGLSDGLTKAFAKVDIKVDCIISEDTKTDNAHPGLEQAAKLKLVLIPSEKAEPRITIKSGNVPFSSDELSTMKIGLDKDGEPYTVGRQSYCFTKLLISEEIIPDKPSVIVKSVIEPEALSSYEVFRILRDNPHMAKNLKHIYETIFFNRLAFPWACFLCAFFALPLATKNERSGIFTAIATAVGIAVLYQVLNEIFMVVGKNGYLSFDLIEDFIHFPLGACLTGLAPTIIFGGYGIYLLKKVG
jgi:lipopolysaccharide export LptBFGC system permease protein LptF